MNQSDKILKRLAAREKKRRAEKLKQQAKKRAMVRQFRRLFDDVDNAAQEYIACGGDNETEFRQYWQQAQDRANAKKSREKIQHRSALGSHSIERDSGDA